MAHPDSPGLAQNKAPRWGYEHGLMLQAIERVWQRTGEAKYLASLTRTLKHSLAAPGATP